jgi:hypothetical protein
MCQCGAQGCTSWIGPLGPPPPPPPHTRTPSLPPPLPPPVQLLTVAYPSFRPPPRFTNVPDSKPDFPGCKTFIKVTGLSHTALMSDAEKAATGVWLQATRTAA